MGAYKTEAQTGALLACEREGLLMAEQDSAGREARKYGRSRPEPWRSRREWKGRAKERKGAEGSRRGSDELK
jgi:hypothetical protein